MTVFLVPVEKSLGDGVLKTLKTLLQDLKYKIISG